jgi:hypothetical protein
MEAVYGRAATVGELLMELQRAAIEFGDEAGWFGWEDGSLYFYCDGDPCEYDL